MIKVTKDSNEIIIRDIPIMRWTVMLLFATFFGFITYSAVIFYLSGRGNSLFFIGALVVVLPLGWAIYTLFTTDVTTTIINRRKQTLTVKKRGLLKNSFETYQFNEIEDGFVRVKVISAKGTYYAIELPLKNGKSIELAAIRWLNKNQYNEVVEEANKYLFDDSNTFKLTILNDD